MLFQKNTTLLFIGDSVTDCGRVRPVGEGDGLGLGYVNMANALLTAKHHTQNIKILNTGISGNTIRDLKNRWQSDVIDLNPDYLSVLIGINDVWRKFDSPDNPELAVGIEEYEAIYRELIETTKRNVRKLILMTPFLAEPNKANPMMKDLLGYIEVVKKLAAEYKDNVILVDLQAEVDRYIDEGMSAAVIAGDRVHPSQTGSMIIAQSFLRACTCDGEI